MCKDSVANTFGKRDLAETLVIDSYTPINSYPTHILIMQTSKILQERSNYKQPINDEPTKIEILKNRKVF